MLSALHLHPAKREENKNHLKSQKASDKVSIELLLMTQRQAMHNEVTNQNTTPAQPPYQRRGI